MTYTNFLKSAAATVLALFISMIVHWGTTLEARVHEAEKTITSISQQQAVIITKLDWIMDALKNERKRVQENKNGS
jgi:hypothetical protein